MVVQEMKSNSATHLLERSCWCQDHLSILRNTPPSCKQCQAGRLPLPIREDKNQTDNNPDDVNSYFHFLNNQ
jgi:hypothetical protein